MEVLSPLKNVLNRISAGIIFGSILLSIFFSLWTLMRDHLEGPVIGTLVFQGIALAFSVFLALRILRAREEEEQAEIVV